MMMVNTEAELKESVAYIHKKAYTYYEPPPPPPFAMLKLAKPMSWTFPSISNKF